LAVFLRLPRDILDTILGDAITVTSHRVMAAVFDGDPAPLHEIIRDPEADEFVRAKMCQTIAMLTRRGDLPRDATAAFLRWRPDRRHNLLGVVEASSSLLRRCNVYHMIKVYT
jgi:hypothetical protein